MNKIKKQYFLLLASLSLFNFPVIVSASEGFYEKTRRAGFTTLLSLGFQAPGEANVVTIAGRYIGIALSFLGAIFLLLIIYGGVLWMTAGGNEEQITKAKKIMIRSLIGFIIVIAAYAITYAVIAIFGPQTIETEQSGF